MIPQFTPSRVQLLEPPAVRSAADQLLAGAVEFRAVASQLRAADAPLWSGSSHDLFRQRVTAIAGYLETSAVLRDDGAAALLKLIGFWDGLKFTWDRLGRAYNSSCALKARVGVSAGAAGGGLVALVDGPGSIDLASIGRWRLTSVRVEPWATIEGRRFLQRSPNLAAADRQKYAKQIVDEVTRSVKGSYSAAEATAYKKLLSGIDAALDAFQSAANAQAAVLDGLTARIPGVIAASQLKGNHPVTDPFIYENHRWRDLKDPVPAKDGGFHKTQNFYRGARGIYPTDGSPNVNDVNQGSIGDCYLMAALSAMADTLAGKALIMKMIRDNRDGTYTVTFPDGRVVEVDADLFVNDDGGPAYAGRDQSVAMRGTWVQILEKAYAAKHSDGYEGIVGGNAYKVWADLGYDVERLELNPVGYDPSDKRLAEVLRDALEAGHPIVATARLHGEGHQLTVVGIQDGYVTLRNPWGLDADKKGFSHNLDYLESLKGTVNASDLPEMGDGFFEIRLDDFTEVFEDIQYVTK